MSDEKKNLDENGNPIEGDQSGAGDGKSKDGGDTPTVESLTAELAKRDGVIENLKGTQSANSKNLNEIKTQLDGYKDSFEKAGIDPSQLNSIISKQSRAAVLVDVASEKGLSASDMSFITGDTKEEIEISVDKFNAAVQSKVDAIAKGLEADGKKKVPIPKDNNKGGDPTPPSSATQAKAFLEKTGMIKK